MSEIFKYLKADELMEGTGRSSAIGTNSVKPTSSTGIFLVLLCYCFIFSSCSTPNNLPTNNDATIHSAIIVIPGYYGTRLVRESDGELIWISPTEALFGEQPLTLPIPGLGLANTVELRPADILDTVRVIPLLYSVDVYGSLIETLRSARKNRSEVISLAYDWRKDLLDAVRKLDTLIHQLKDEGKDDISLVAHSMGGLIVSYYLRYGIQEIASAVETWRGAGMVSSVVMAGVPFQGVMNSFRNMNFGATVKLNASLLTAEAYSSFPSSYFTLPIGDPDLLLTSQLEPLKGKIRNPKNWKRYSWGLLNKTATLSETTIKQRADYQTMWLRRSQRFLELLQAPVRSNLPQHPPLLYLYAKGKPTLSTGVWMADRTQGAEALYFDNRALPLVLRTMDSGTLFEDGDGTVSVRSAALPLAYRDTFRTTIRECEVGHTELVTDSPVQEAILSFLEKP